MSEAAALGVEPAGFDTTTLYRPALAGVTLSRLSVALVAFGISSALKRHWYVNGGVPHTLTLKETLPLVGATRSCGCAVIAGRPGGRFSRGRPAVGGSALQFSGSLPCRNRSRRCKE